MFVMYGHKVYEETTICKHTIPESYAQVLTWKNSNMMQPK